MSTYEKIRKFCVELYNADHLPEEVEESIKKLIELKINPKHATAQLFFQKYLRGLGYEVEIEKQLRKGQRCDIYAKRDNETLIVEIETGKESDERREISKIVRYSTLASGFAIAVIPGRKLQISKEWIVEKNENKMREIVNELSRQGYEISLDELRKSKLDSIYIYDMKRGFIEKVLPSNFLFDDREGNTC